MLLSAAQISGGTFDYVVIGGGASGLTVATRLSEDPSVSVLVIEAGPSNLDDPDILTPIAFGTHFGKEKYDWNFRTLPQRLCQNRVLPFNRGKGLGGSSAINFFQYHRPAKSDIDAFGELGNKGWNWDLLEYYYSKAEQFVEPTIKSEGMGYDLSSRGVKGPLTIAYPSIMSNFEIPFQIALKSLGVDLVKEPFSGNTKGTWLTPVSIDPDQRVRSYSANKYYQPNASRKNFTVIASAHVTKILSETNTHGITTATHVEFINNGSRHIVKVGKEVILSAGAIMSPQVPKFQIGIIPNTTRPQILELSGIGDPEILRAAGVEPRVHLPGVGNNVQEHIYAGVTREIRPELVGEYYSVDSLHDPEERARQQNLYRTSGTGIYGTSPSSMAFLPLASISSTLQNSITKSHDAERSNQTFPSLEKQYHVQREHIRHEEPTCEFIFTPRFRVGPNPFIPGKQYITVATFLNHPWSRGAIHISSSDPLVHPNIDPHYFEHEYDLLAFVEQLKFCRKILEQEPLKRLLTPTEVNPGPDVKTNEQVSEYLKSSLTSSWRELYAEEFIDLLKPVFEDTVGSCSMLPLTDGGVVDNNLKVYHTTNIRVVDVSIIPLHVGAHLQATAYALGELAADLIKGRKLPEA
ncbi:alcohol oxidase [Mycena capillaripes]|nr:alcohol oxidase [Mycena capillaripes]